MKAKDKSRKWMWMFLAALVSLQVYFVWELLAVFALLGMMFALIAWGANNRPRAGQAGTPRVSGTAKHGRALPSDNF